MTVWYRQDVDGEAGEPIAIEYHAAGQTDADLMALKVKGAQDKGWAITRLDDRSFTATKERWGGSLVVREFWID